MECNKDEALKAVDSAERKLQSKDFEGARRLALKAQQLFPNLENISQLMTVCEVHCAAEKKLYGSEMDWYKILNVENRADEVAIKKQYRKLAFFIHPDKNKFPGAEAAFKIIEEAKRVLLDRDKRSMYDMKCRVPVRNTAAPRAPPHHVNNSFTRKKGVGQNSFPTVPNPQFTASNPHQQSQSVPQDMPGTFWTWCPFCKLCYQYSIKYENKILRCQSCAEPFMAHNTGGGPHDVRSVPNMNYPNFTQNNPVGSRSYSGTPVFPTGVPGNFTSKTVGVNLGTKPGNTNNISRMSRTKRKGNEQVDVGSVKKCAGMSKQGAEKGKSSAAKNTNRKRVGKQKVESSESSDSSSSDESEDDIDENVSSYAGQGAGSNGGEPRRSSRQKQRVTYKEPIIDDDDDDNFVIPPNGSWGSGLSSSTEKEIKTDGGRSDNCADSQKASAPHEESSPNKKKKVDSYAENGVESSPNAEKSKLQENSEPNLNGVIEYPDPDFSDFDKEKTENCFAANQVWAVYDETEGMPRYYGLIKKIHPKGFRVKIAWLEADANERAEFEWVLEGLPVACGRFKPGDCEDITDSLMFSHKVDIDKSLSKRGSYSSYVIYPRQGQTWALFKDWDIKWTNENRKSFKYELVSIVSDFDQREGIRVAHLRKVRGFVSLFQTTTRNGHATFQLPRSELFRFSHQIPSFKMTGEEREGVPSGSFELDPVSLPTDLDQFY